MKFKDLSKTMKINIIELRLQGIKQKMWNKVESGEKINAKAFLKIKKIQDRLRGEK